MITADQAPTQASPSDPMTASVEPDPAADRFVEVLYPSVWLVFLVFPAVGVLGSEAPAAQKVLGLSALALFAAVYVASWWWPRPLRGLGRRATAGLWLLGLLACTALLLPFHGPAVISLYPFLSATLAFRLSPRDALWSVGLLATGAVVLLLGVWASVASWGVPMVAITTVLMLSLRAILEREDRARDIAQQLRLSQERESLGRDVHDLLGHSLTVITVKTELARRLVDKDPDRASRELDEVLALSRDATAQVRQAVGSLRSPLLSDQVAAARTALEAAGIRAELPDPRDLPDGAGTVLAWCLREAVTNVVRHSGAERCRVDTGPDRLVVEDDGVGLPQDVLLPDRPTVRGGQGLRGMRDRVEHAGGQLRLGPAERLGSPARPGTRLEVILP